MDERDHKAMNKQGEKLKTDVSEKVDKMTKQVEEKKQTDEEYMKEFVESKENQEKARGLAEQIIEHVSKNWFDMNRMMKRTGSDQKDCMNKLAILSKFGLCIVRRGAKGLDYKITFSSKDMIANIEKQIAGLEIQMKILKNKLQEHVERN
ncbi:hypothetical protein KA005_64375, partial [bacterium]|nr:hypothetical protein [bacterium]